jgi:hypothetical protein
MTSSCLLCGTPALERVLDLGPQPVSTHFTPAAGDAVVRHRLAVAVCRACGVVQLAPPFPFRDLVPPYDWITYREPEAHLDLVTERLLARDSVRAARRAAGISFKDDTTLARLKEAGVPDVWRLDLRADLGAADPRANIESVPGLLTQARAAEIVAARGPVDLLVARHVVEHAGDPRGFLAALGAMLAPGGHLVIEVPDCRANLERQDYTMLWEEHSLYFTPETIGQALAPAGCVPVSLDIHPFPFEDVIVLVGRKLEEGAAPRAPDHAAARSAVSLALTFSAAHPAWSERIAAALDRLAGGRRLAAYGAGHLACAFLNFHGVADRFAFVVDDTPQKQGLFLPGSGVPIVPREALAAGEVGACLFGLAPEIEDKVIARNPEFVVAGGVFASMFADSPRSLRRLMS